MHMQEENKITIRIAVVDDSAYARGLLVTILQRDSNLHVIGVGADGKDAINLVKLSHPNILLVDLHMPKMDGLEATRQIMREAPLPIVLTYDITTVQETEQTFNALQAGAIAVVRKPQENDVEGHADLIRTIKTMANVPVIHHWGRSRPKDTKEIKISQTFKPFTEKSILSIVGKLSNIDVIGVASSTGGPAALATILKDLPRTFPVPILIVQHISKGFDTGFAEWLGKQVKLKVVTISQRDRLHPGSIFLPKGDHHLEIPAKGLVALSNEPPYKGLRPSANYLFDSLAKFYGQRCLGLILTGMGDDGVKGLIKLHKSGGFVIAQDESSCIVYGMPKEAVIQNAVDEVLSLEQIAQILVKIASRISSYS